MYCSALAHSATYAFLALDVMVLAKGIFARRIDSSTAGQPLRSGKSVERMNARGSQVRSTQHFGPIAGSAPRQVHQADPLVAILTRAEHDVVRVSRSEILRQSVRSAY